MILLDISDNLSNFLVFFFIYSIINRLNIPMCFKVPEQFLQYILSQEFFLLRGSAIRGGFPGKYGPCYKNKGRRLLLYIDGKNLYGWSLWSLSLH